MKIETTPMANPTRIALKIQFEHADFNEKSADYPDQSFLELYDMFHEFKTQTVHDLITSEPYKDKIILLSIVDHVYELWHDIVINAEEHVSDRSQCIFCSLEFELEC